MKFQRIKAVKDAVMEILLAQFIPHVLNRIKLRRIGWKFEQIDVLGCFERVTAMPARTVYYHHDALVWMTLGHLIQKQLHAVCIDMWQDQTLQLSRANIYRPVHIGVLVRQHRLA